MSGQEMFGSAILEVAIGVVFGFLAVSLFSSALVEAINSALKLRASKLKQGVQELLNDPNFNGLAKELYGHALVNPLGPGGAAPDKVKPAYIDAQHFASALLDVVGATGSATAADLKQTFEKVTDEQIRKFLL